MDNYFESIEILGFAKAGFHSAQCAYSNAKNWGLSPLIQSQAKENLRIAAGLYADRLRNHADAVLVFVKELP